MGLLFASLMSKVSLVLPSVLTSRMVDWPRSQHDQDRVLAEQWLEHYRMIRIALPFAEFELA
jgi:hypothetical protein